MTKFVSDHESLLSFVGIPFKIRHIGAQAQMVILETELKGALAPPLGSGIHPETVFAVGRYVNSPRERGFVVIRSRGKLDV